MIHRCSASLSTWYGSEMTPQDIKSVWIIPGTVAAQCMVPLELFTCQGAPVPRSKISVWARALAKRRNIRRVCSILHVKIRRKTPTY